ncbi:nucleolar MIF4G domain-containing protein 1 isoform X1 [Maniola jurtina]|uniref:nucleolar MIF4G domain-containing protein 1 isoform X1 n=2 Tax=Maniola jurtina TaxID=191418 RepID=UPI001E689497|nr:nucleolar MIF4G domain-containing protein 1 isoform X1 [Maniola jurtina]
MKKVKTANRPKFPNTRKALRKEKRKQKKINRQDHYLRKKNESIQPKYVAGKFVKRPADSPVFNDEPISKKPKAKVETTQDIVLRQLNKERNEANKLKSQMNEQRKKMMLQANEDEEKMIKKLEKQLGLNKAKNKTKTFAEDGLDYLLEICDRTTSEQIVAAEKHLAEVEHDSDFEEDLAVVTGKEIPKKSKKDKEKKEKDKSEDKIDSDADEMDLDDDSDQPVSGESEISEDDCESNDSELDDYEESVKKSNKKSLSSNKESSKEKHISEDDNVSESELNDSSDHESEKSESDEESVKKSTKTCRNKQSSKEEKSKTKSKQTRERIVSEKDLSKVFSDDEVSELSGNEDLSGDENGGVQNTSAKEEVEKPDVWEDIYGRKRDKEGNIIKEEKGVYVPPHLRNKDSVSDKELAQLKRQIKSVLNKLAGTNLHWACTSIENLYSSNSRHSVNTALTQLWLDATVQKALTADRMLAEHAALIAVLHANVGSEIGAHFLEELSRKFDAMMETPQPVQDKTLDNLVGCLALLYSFKIYQASLLYDILTRLVDELSEKSIDCVLTALRNVGGVLRKEEPAALKTFIHDTQTKVTKLNQSADTGSRIKFLLEVLLAVKNNNLNKIPNYDPTYIEHLKKMCRGIVRKGNYVTTLNIRLEDLLKAHERGKWWVVGSAWEGSRVQEDKQTVNLPASSDQRLLELARKQRMNTDVRRSIFCVIMAAEDYMDAFEKLQHLGLKGQQEREVIHVLLACCLQEKTYNPYYGVLGQKLCDYDRKYQLSIQYSVWDKIKELDSLSKQGTANLAQFLIHLIMQKGLPLSVLKIIQFSDLNKTTVRFMRQILLAIIMNEDLQTSLEVFHRISKPPKLHMFRESLRLFIQHFLIKNAGKKTTVLSDEDMATLKERAVEVDRILTLYENKLRL